MTIQLLRFESRLTFFFKCFHVIDNKSNVQTQYVEGSQKQCLPLKVPLYPEISVESCLLIFLSEEIDAESWVALS